QRDDELSRLLELDQAGDRREGGALAARHEELPAEDQGEPGHADRPAHEVAGLAQAAQLAAQPVAEGPERVEEERPQHQSSRSVALRKICSRLEPAAAVGTRAASSASVPSATFTPRSRITMRVQISSTRWRRCDETTTAAPARPRATIVSFMRRIPSGSRPVSGSSNRSTVGSWIKPQAMTSFC